MQNLMDVLHFKINMKNLIKSTDSNAKINELILKLEVNESETIQRINLMEQKQTELREMLSNILAALNQNAEAVKTIEYHCRFPSVPLTISTNIDSLSRNEFSISSEDEKSSDDEDPSTFSISEGNDQAGEFQFCTIRVVYSMDGVFTEDEYFKFNGTKCEYSAYENRNWSDKYTAVRLGRIKRSVIDSDKIINDIAFEIDGKGVSNVSKEHATILYDKGIYFAADLGSVNSTFIKIKTEIVLREGIVFDICKDNLFVVHQIVTPIDHKFCNTKSDSIIDPYTLFVEGKAIKNEYIQVNKLRKKRNKENENQGYDTMIQLRFIENASSSICNFHSDEIITITNKDIEENDKYWIGRNKNLNIILQNDNSISRKHCFIYLNENNDWCLDCCEHEVYLSLRLEYEWPELKFENENKNCDIDSNKKDFNRESSNVIELKDGMQMRISDTLFEFNFS